ncbi:hypothetical protein CDEN61S_00169 [Castellaniella denitrificans]
MNGNEAGEPATPQPAGGPGPEADRAPLRVMHVISGLLHGGAETVLFRLATAPGGTVRHTVVSMRGEGVMGARLREAGVEVVCLDMQGWTGNVRGLWRLVRLLRERRPDVVQTWMYHADLIAGLVARLAGIRAVAWGVRNSGVSLGESSRSSRIAAWACARVSSWVPGVIVACARKAAEVHRAWGYRADRVLVVPNGYDLDVWHPDAAGAADGPPPVSRRARRHAARRGRPLAGSGLRIHGRQFDGRDLVQRRAQQAVDLGIGLVDEIAADGGLD